jgi:hypothetical protein
MDSNEQQATSSNSHLLGTSAEYQAGYAAGLASPHGTWCPYDGRTRAGKSWWAGFMAGDSQRCAEARAREAGRS